MLPNSKSISLFLGIILTLLVAFPAISHAAHASVASVQLQQLQQHQKLLQSCPNNCSGHGDCNEETGICLCPFDYVWSEDCSQTRKEFIDMDKFERYVLFVLVIYAILELVTVSVLLYMNWGWPIRGVTAQTVCYLCLLVAFGSRLAYYGIDPGAFYLILPAWADRVLHFIMFVLLFSAFTAILYNWAASNWRASMARKEALDKLRKSFIGINLAVYGIEVVFTIVTAVLDNGQGYLRTKSVLLYLIFMCIKLLVMGGAFAYFGVKIYLQMKKFTPLSSDGLRAIRLVKILTAVTTTIFILALVYIALFVWKVRFRSEMFMISDAVINIFSWIASGLVMILLGKPRRPRKKERSTEKNFGTFPESTPGSNRASQGSDASTPHYTDEE